MSNDRSTNRAASAAVKTGSFVALILLTLSLSCSKIPSDAKLKELFYANRDDFNTLVRMAQQDIRVVRIDFDFNYVDSGQKNVGLSPERWQEYRVLFRKLGLSDGLGRPKDIPSAILFYVQCEGSAIDGDCKGIAYSGQPLAPTQASLDSMPPNGTFFEPLSPNWYLFRWVS